MYRVIVLNQTSKETFGREYNAFISALCLARMGCEVLHVGSASYAQGFYQGSYCQDVDIFNLNAPSLPAMLPIGFDMLPYNKFDINSITDCRLRDRVAAFGRVDCVFYSGLEYMASFAKQVAAIKGAVTCSLDWKDEAPCVNEIQLNRPRRPVKQAVTRVVSFAEYMWEDEVVRLKAICRHLGDYELWLGATIPHPDGEEIYPRLRRDRIYCQPRLSDSGRFVLLSSANLYVEPNESVNRQGLAEAICAGVPAFAPDGRDVGPYFENLIMRELPEEIILENAGAWVSRTRVTARHRFNVGRRIMHLYNRMVDLGC